MDDNVIISKINEYLHTATILLANWLDIMLPQVDDNWWQNCVLGKLTDRQYEIATESGYSKLVDFDLAALIRICDKNWYGMRTFAYLPTYERDNVRNLMSVRNNWAHLSGELPGKDVIVNDINVLSDVLAQLHVDNSVIYEINDFRTAVETRGSLRPQTEVQPAPAVFKPDAEDEIKEKSLVYLVGTPEKKGMVFSVDHVGNIKQYGVFVDGELKTFYEGQIAPVTEEKFKWETIETFKSCLTAFQINNPSSENLYSLNSARIDFVPYQFRPALKMIKSDEPRILIADSVGVGKTIEAGLIIKELDARNDLNNIMIICPKPLVAERKWELEMKRFDEDFTPLDGSTLRQIIKDTDRDGEWPVRFSKTIVPYSILDARVYEGSEEKKKSFEPCLQDLDPAPHFDLVIVDEAHHIRNGSMEKEKAYAYKCVKYFCDHADAVVMLTATPLQNKDEDLYTLLNILRPDIVLDMPTFNMMSRPNEYISRSSTIIRGASEDWQQRALVELNQVLNTQWGENVIAPNPVYQEAVKTLSKAEVSREERVKLITDVESLHSFNLMLNRTRRRDIQDFCVRRSFTLESEFTPEQEAIYNELMNFEATALSILHDPRCVPFLMSTIRRQAASCIYGLVPHINEIISRRFAQLNDDPDFDLDSFVISDDALAILSSEANRLVAMANALPDDDPKFNQVLEIINEKQKLENNKIILFSTFRNTLAYIRKKLDKTNIRYAQIDGSVKDEQRVDCRNRFELPKEDENALDILLFTEVGSEGLDYQFCDTMINYDIPWNPMRIEQRIGRIDRRGQKSEAVSIYNVITANTVDADIYTRCLMRIGVFEKSIGECEEILGEIGKKIELIAADGKLTPEERRIKLEQMADNEVRKMQELVKLEDEQKALFGFDLSKQSMAQEIQDAESPWLSVSSLQYLVERYLKARIGEGQYIYGDSEVKSLRLSMSARLLLKEDLAKLPNVRTAAKRDWELYLKGANPNHSITFESEAADRDRKAFFITPVHPLVRQAAAYFAADAPKYISLKYPSDEVPCGKYPFTVYTWNYLGDRPQFKLMTVCENETLAEELPDILQSGHAITYQDAVSKDLWKALEPKHYEIWEKNKAEYVEEAKQLAAYKLESITNNFKNRERVLKQQINDNPDSNIVRMRMSELETATERYQTKKENILSKIEQTDIHFDLIANGIIDVVQGV